MRDCLRCLLELGIGSCLNIISTDTSGDITAFRLLATRGQGFTNIEGSMIPVAPTTSIRSNPVTIIAAVVKPEVGDTFYTSVLG